jgi:hypothetical protein
MLTRGLKPPTEIPNLQEEARQVAKDVLQEVNGTGKLSGPSTPEIPSTPTPLNNPHPFSANSHGPAKIPSSSDLDKRPSSPFRGNTKIQVTTSERTINAEIDKQIPPNENFRPNSLSGKSEADGSLDIVANHEKGTERNRRRSKAKMENEPLFLKSESTGGTEHRSNSVIHDKVIEGKKT